MPQPVAGVIVGKICAVGNEPQSVFPAVIFYFRPCAAEQRADYPAPYRRYSAKPVRPCSAGQIEKNGFELVARRMRRSNKPVRNFAFKKAVARLPCGKLKALSGFLSQRRNVLASCCQRYFKTFAKTSHKPFVPVRLRAAYHMVEMSGRNGYAKLVLQTEQSIKKGDGIRSS